MYVIQRIYYHIALWSGAKYIQVSMSVCLFVSLFVRLHNWKTTRQNFTKTVCACFLWPWLDSSLTALRYVMYFRFCGWFHIFISWDQRAGISSTTLYLEEYRQITVPGQLGLQCLVHFMQNAAPGAKSAIYDWPVYYARQHICYSAYMLWQFRLSVRPSVCHTGGSVKNGWS